MAKVVIETELSTKNFDRQIQKLKTDIARYMRVLESDTKVPISLRMSPAERQELETTIEKLRNRLDSSLVRGWTQGGRVRYNKSMTEEQMKASIKALEDYECNAKENVVSC